MVDLNKIQIMQDEFVKSRRWDRFDQSLIFIHLMEEISEIGSHILYEKKYKVSGAGHKQDIDKGKLSEEFAQSFNLFLQLASSFGVDLETAWFKELERNKDRFSEELWRKLAEE